MKCTTMQDKHSRMFKIYGGIQESQLGQKHLSVFPKIDSIVLYRALG